MAEDGGFELYDEDEEPMQQPPPIASHEEPTPVVPPKKHWYEKFDEVQPTAKKQEEQPPAKKQVDEEKNHDPQLTPAAQPKKHWYEKFEEVQPTAKKQVGEEKNQDPQRTPAAQPKKHADGEDYYKKQKPQEPKDDFAETMEEKVRTAIPDGSAEPPTICEVPEDLAEGNEGAYIPKVVCIGPLFDRLRGTPGMLRLERYKWRCVRKLVVGRRRAAGVSESPSAAAWSPEVHAPLLRKCFDKMMRLAPRIRASYCSISNDDDDDEQLALHMLLDGCFVLHRLLKYARSPPKGNNAGDLDEWALQFGRCWVWGTVKRDLLLLSNQVPFFVVRKLFKLLGRSAGEGEDVLVRGGLELFASLHPRPMHPAGAPTIACHDVHHLLHLLYLSIDLPPGGGDDDEPPPSSSKRHRRAAAAAAAPPSELTRWLPCAKELEEAGVKLRPRGRGAARSFLDVSFRGGVLEIPPLQLFDYSVPLFRNLIAFEQTYPRAPGRVTAYAIFMDCLVKTPEDVRILHRGGVLVNHMNGDREDTALGFFSGLCAQAHSSASRNHLAAVMEEVARYQSGRWPRWRAALQHDYFPNPWVTAAVVAAAIGLSMTLLQTFYTIYPYYNPSN